MATAKKKCTSLLLVFCLTLAMVAGILVAAPVTVKAAPLATIAYNSNYITVTFSPWGCGISMGKLFIIYDDLGNEYSYTSIFKMEFKDSTMSSSIFSTSFTPKFVYDSARTYYSYIEPGYFIDGNGKDLLQGEHSTLPPSLRPPPGPTPPGPTPTDPSLTPDGIARDRLTAEYEERHFDFWMNHYYAMYALPDGGKYTVDTTGQSIDHIRHFIFDIVCDKGLTLTVKYNGQTYVFTRSNIRDSMRGNNHLFENLGRYKNHSMPTFQPPLF